MVKIPKTAEDLVEQVVIEANRISAFDVKTLRKLHPDNSNGSSSFIASRHECVYAYLTEEFSLEQPHYLVSRDLLEDLKWALAKLPKHVSTKLLAKLNELEESQ